MLKNLSSREWQLLVLGSCTTVIYLFILMLVSVYQIDKFLFQSFYFISALLFPLGLCWVFKRCFNPGTEHLRPVGLWLLLSNLLLIASLSFLTPPYPIETASTALCIWAAAQLIYWIWQAEGRTDPLTRWRHSAGFMRLLCVLIALVPVMAFTNSFYGLFLNTAYDLLRFFYQSKQSVVLWVFGCGSLLALMLLVQVFFFEKRASSRLSKYYTVLLCFSPLLLFDVVNNFDIEHYNAYVAPAIAVLHGKIPLIDVFCHYGFSYLLFTLVFMILPNTYGVLGAVVSGLNVWCLILFLLMLRRLVKNPSYFLILSITTVFGSHYLLAHSENIVPSAIAMRYFPTFLIVYCLFKRFYGTASDTQFYASPLLLFLLILNALWSLESILFLVVIIAAYFWLRAESIQAWCIAMLKLFALVFGVYLLIALVYRVAFHEFPSYKNYIKYIYYYLDPHTKIGSRFLFVNNSFLSRFFVWVPLAIMHVVGLFFLLYHRVIRKIHHPAIQSLLFVNAAAVATIVYFVFQPSLFTFICTGYLSLLVLIGSLVQLQQHTRSACCRFGLNLSLVIISYIFLVILALAVKSRPTTGDPNGNMLTQFLDNGQLFNENFFYNLNHFCTKKVLEDRGEMLAITENTCTRNAYHQEMSDLIDKWFKNETEILLFHRDLIEALVEHRKIHRLMVSPLNDYLSYDIRKQVMRKVDKAVHAGDVLMVEKDLNLFPIEIAILKKISQSFHFVLLEETPHFKIFRLSEKQNNQKSDLMFAIEPKGAVSSLLYRSKYTLDEVKGGVAALFDHDKETTWFATKESTFNRNIFWVKINLGEPFVIDKIKLWRNIDFRVPTYVSKKRNYFPQHFNIKLSQDAKHWRLLQSVTTLDLGDNDYYQISLNGQTAQYLMINVFLSGNDSFYISEIEVFGQKLSP